MTKQREGKYCYRECTENGEVNGKWEAGIIHHVPGGWQEYATGRISDLVWESLGFYDSQDEASTYVQACNLRANHMHGGGKL